jgi:transcriptional regulator with XRE-family HTH domain
MARNTLVPIAPDVLREAMYRVGLDMVQLAEKAHVTQQFVSLVLLGHRRCNPSIAAAIADALGQPVDRLFTSALSDLSHNTEVSMSAIELDDPYLTFEEVAAMANMPIKTLRHYRHHGKGPAFFPMGGRLKIRRSRAVAWLRSFEDGEDGAAADETP